jgi:hypothetical protein
MAMMVVAARISPKDLRPCFHDACKIKACRHFCQAILLGDVRNPVLERSYQSRQNARPIRFFLNQRDHSWTMQCGIIRDSPMRPNPRVMRRTVLLCMLALGFLSFSAMADQRPAGSSPRDTVGCYCRCESHRALPAASECVSCQNICDAGGRTPVVRGAQAGRHAARTPAHIWPIERVLNRSTADLCRTTLAVRSVSQQRYSALLRLLVQSKMPARLWPLRCAAKL